MSIVNTLKKQVDLPVFEWTRFSPTVSSAISCSTAAVNSNIHPFFGRYIYYLIATSGFWRYDTWGDSYLQLSSPPITPITYSTMRFDESIGLETNVLAAGTNTLTIPGYFGQASKSYDIIITAGTGAGQRRTITYVADIVMQDMGVATTVSNALGSISITDTLKNWAINQWVGYSCRITQGSGVSQVRKIIYNTATVLTFADSTISGSENLYNPMIFSPAISSTAGSQSVYQIESSTVTVDTPWLTQPDTTSRFIIQSGTIVLFSGAAATPFYTLQHYDVLTDTWFIRSANTLNFGVVGTDSSVEVTPENASVWAKSTATGGVTGTTGVTGQLIDTNQNWTTNQWVGYYARVFSGTAEGQLLPIGSNTATTLTYSYPTGISGTTATDTTSQYMIEGYDAGIATSGTVTTLVDTSKNWAMNRWKNYQVKITFGTNKGLYVPILSNTSNTLTFYKPFVSGIDSTSKYVITADPDKMYMMMAADTEVLIHNFQWDTASYGRPYDQGVASNASVTFGSNKPIAIASLSNVTTTATVTTAINHFYKVGQSVTVAGANDSNFNGTFTIATVPSLTTFTYTMGGTPASTTLLYSQSTSTLSDSTKSWTVNQWAGYMVYMNVTAVTAASGLATGQAVQITSNTAHTLTFVTTLTAPLNGITRYVITQRDAIGQMFNGIATGTQSTVLLTDTNVSSASTTASISGTTLTVTNVSAGYLGIGSVITGGTTLAGTTIIAYGPNTFGGIGTYTVNYSQSVVSGTITSSGWAVNFFAGRKLKLIGATGQGQQVSITSNTSNALTFGAITTAPVTTVTSYVILQQLTRGLGLEMKWAFGNSDSTIRGKRVHIPRGGATIGFDYFDITTDKFEQSAITPQAESLTTGSMYAYDGTDRIYFTKEVTQRLYYLDTVTENIHGAGQYPYAAGTAIIGNRMDIFQTSDGLKYLWLNRHSNFECFRALISIY